MTQMVHTENVPEISVIVPVYNVERWLGRCLDSILNQSFSDLEVVCVNDCSPDASASVLEEYAARDPRVRIVNHSENKGLMATRATGRDAARGRYYCFVDSDDTIPAGSLKALHDKAEATGADIVVGDLYYHNTKGSNLLRSRRKAAGPHGLEYLRLILGKAITSLCGNLFRATIFTDHQYQLIPGQQFWEDRILLTQILTVVRPKVAVVEAPAYDYIMNTASLSRSKHSREFIRGNLSALFWCYDYLNRNYPEVRADNRRLLTRNLSLWLERGTPVKFLETIHPDVRELLRFSNIRAITSPRFAFHTAMCRKSRLYGLGATAGRRLIRKIQGKD